MGYSENEIVELCKKEMLNPPLFYRAGIINYRGKTTDTHNFYNEIVAKYVCEHLDEFTLKIPMITRQETYKTASHTGKRIPSDLRKEEQIAVKLFNQKHFDCIGEIIDYQTPLKNESDDTAGKIDLLSYDGEKLYILELKKPDSTETMLRCVLEGYTYMKTADTKKLLKDFGLPADTKIVACPLVFFSGEQHKEMSEYRPELKKVMKLLDSKPYFIIEENNKYNIVED